MGVRVYELARTLGLSSKALMHELKQQGIDLKSHMSSIDDETAELVADLLKTPPAPPVREPPLAPAVLAEAIEVPRSDAPASFTPEVVAPPPTPSVPAVADEPTPVVAIEPPSVVAAVDAPVAVKSPPEKRLRLGEASTVKELAEKMDARPAEVIKVLMKMGVMVTINAVIDREK